MKKSKKVALLIGGLGLAVSISSCDTDISINFSTFTSLVGDYSDFTDKTEFAGANGARMTLTESQANITCPTGYVVLPVSNKSPSDGRASAGLTCSNANGCDTYEIGADTGAAPNGEEANADLGSRAEIVNNVDSDILTICVPKSQLAYWS